MSPPISAFVFVFFISASYLNFLPHSPKLMPCLAANLNDEQEFSQNDNLDIISSADKHPSPPPHQQHSHSHRHHHHHQQHKNHAHIFSRHHPIQNEFTNSLDFDRINSLDWHDYDDDLFNDVEDDDVDDAVVDSIMRSLDRDIGAGGQISLAEPQEVQMNQIAARPFHRPREHNKPKDLHTRRKVSDSGWKLHSNRKHHPARWSRTGSRHNHQQIEPATGHHPFNHLESNNHQVPEQSPIVVSSSDNSYVSASPIIVNNDIANTPASATTTTPTTTTTSRNNFATQPKHSLHFRLHKNAPAILSSFRSIQNNQLQGKGFSESTSSSTEPAHSFVFVDQQHNGVGPATMVTQVPHDSKRYSNIIRSPANELPLHGRKYWHDSHLASINIQQEDPNDFDRTSPNSAIIAIMFGVGATGMLVLIIQHKLNSLRARVAYKGRRRSLVPDTDYLINTIPI